MPTPYEILEISPTASPDEIRKAYKKLVIKHHPDKGGEREKFEEVRQAYETLSHPESSSASSSYSASGFNFNSNFDAKAFWAELELEESNKPPKPEHWRIKFLSKNKIFSRYAEHVLKMLQIEIHDPIVILDKLFDLYIENDSIFTKISFWGFGRTHVALARELKDLLKQPESAPSAVMDLPVKLANVFSRIENEPGEFNSNGEFIELFNAFFAMFPLYLAALNNAHKLKKQVVLTAFDDVMAQTMFRSKTRELIYSTNNIHHLGQDDVNLIAYTGELTQAVNFIIQHIMSASELDQFCYISNLTALTEQAPAIVIENIIFPFILKIFQQEDPENKFIYFPYKIMCKTIQIVNPVFVEDQILPLFISSQHLRKNDNFSAILREIALRLGKEVTTKDIFPLLIKLLQEIKDNEEGSLERKRQQYLTEICRVLHLVSPEMVLQLLAPILGKYVVVELGSYVEGYQLYARLLELEKTTAGEEKLKWANVIKEVSPAFEKDMTEMSSEDNYKLIAMSGEMIAAKSSGYINRKFPDLDKVYFTDSKPYQFSEVLNWLDTLSKLPEEKVSTEFKRAIFAKLYALSAKNFTPTFVKTLKKYFPYGNDPHIFADLYERLFAKADFTSKRSYLSSIEPALAEIVMYVDPQILQTKLLPFFLNSVSPKIEKNSPISEILKNALARIDLQYVMQTVFPEFFYRILKAKGFGEAEVEVDLLIPFISKLSYTHSVQLKMRLIQAIEENKWSEAPKRLLYALSKHHQVLIKECKPQVVVEQEQRPLFG